MTPQESQQLWGAIVTMALTLLPAITAYIIYVLHEQMNAQHDITMRNQAGMQKLLDAINDKVSESTVPTNADLSKQIRDSTATLKQNGAKP